MYFWGKSRKTGFGQLTALLFSLLLAVGCGSDGNRVDSSSFGSSFRNPGLPSDTQSLVDGYLSSSACNFGGGRIFAYYQGTGGTLNSGSQSITASFTRTQGPSGNALVRGTYVGRNVDLGDVAIVYDYGNGVYEMELHLCVDGTITLATSLYNVSQARITFQSNIGRNVGGLIMVGQVLIQNPGFRQYPLRLDFTPDTF